MTRSIAEVLKSPKIEPKWQPIYRIHSMLLDGDYVGAVLSIHDTGMAYFFSEYYLFLRQYSASVLLRSMLWEEAFEVFTSPVYSQLWAGLDDLPKEKPRKSKKFEWYDSLVLGQNY